MITLIILAGIFKALQDNEVRKGRVLKSWKNKWALDGMLQPLKYEKVWYYLGIYKPDFKERFAFSSTLLVSSTDKWHLFGSLRDFSLLTALSISLSSNIPKVILITIALKTIMSIAFQVIFTLLKKNDMINLIKKFKSLSGLAKFAIGFTVGAIILYLLPEWSGWWIAGGVAVGAITVLIRWFK